MDRQRVPVSQPRLRRKSWKSYVILAGIVIILTPVVAVGVFIARFNPNAYAPQIIAAVQRATGRTLSIGGPIELQLSLHPTLAASNLSLANPADFADRYLLTLDKVQARIALLPLLSHRVDILNLRLIGPKLYLERNQAGQADWNFSAVPPQGSITVHAPPATLPTYKIALESVELDNGQIILRPQGLHQPNIVQLTRLSGRAASLSAPLHLSGSAAIGNAPLTLHGVVGPVARLTGTGSSPWPVDLTFGFAGASAHLQGAVTRPQSAKGYNVTLTAAVPALATVTAALPRDWLGRLHLPALHNMTAHATITDDNAPLPALTNISIKAGASDLASLAPGLSLTELTVELPNLGHSGTLSASGTLGQTPFIIRANFTAPSAFIPPSWLPASAPPAASFSESVNASLGTASLSLTGGIATPRTLSGAAMALALNIPNLSALSAAAGQPLPAWKNITIKTSLIDPGGQGLAQAVGLDGLTGTMDNARFSGDVRFTYQPEPKLEIDLSIAQANLDALLAAMPKPQTQPAAPSATAPQLAQPKPAQIVPDISLPLDLLRQASADVVLNANSLTYGGATYRALQGHATLNNGLLTINPLTGQLPGGAISGSGSINASEDPAAETLKLNAPALALGPFLRSFGLAGAAQGTIQAQLNASAKGNTLPQMLATITGQLGLASVNDVVDGRIIGQMFGGALQSAGLPARLAAAPGPVSLRCAALRLDAANGSGVVKALALDSNRLLLRGDGTVNFADQTLGLVLKPRLRVGGTNVTVPVQVRGTFLAPSYNVAPQSAVAAAAQAASGLTGTPLQQALGGNTLLGQAARALTSNNNTADICPAALSLARMGKPGPAPAAAPASNTAAPSGASQPQQMGPRNLLNGLFGQ